MRTPKLFFYGTLQDPDILAAVLGRVASPQVLLPAEAPGFRAVYYPGQVYPALIVAPTHVARGLVLTEASPADLAALEAFEGDGYVREPITLVASGQQMQALYYRASIPVPADALPWTLAAWQARHKPLGLAAETAAAIAARKQGLAAQRKKL